MQLAWDYLNIRLPFLNTASPLENFRQCPALAGFFIDGGYPVGRLSSVSSPALALCRVI